MPIDPNTNRYRNPNMTEEAAIRDAEERRFTDAATLAIGMAVRGGLGTITSIIGPNIQCSGDPGVNYVRSEITIDMDADAVISAAVLADLGGATIVSRTARQITVTLPSTLSIVRATNVDMPEAMQMELLADSVA